MRRKRVCREWLMEYLGQHGEVDSKILREAAEAAGYCSATLHSTRYHSNGRIVFRLNARSSQHGSKWMLTDE